jgi:hypothetical protein
MMMAEQEWRLRDMGWVWNCKIQVEIVDTYRFEHDNNAIQTITNSI